MMLLIALVYLLFLYIFFCLLGSASKLRANWIDGNVESTHRLAQAQLQLQLQSQTAAHSTLSHTWILSAISGCLHSHASNWTLEPPRTTQIHNNRPFPSHHLFGFFCFVFVFFSTCGRRHRCTQFQFMDSNEQAFSVRSRQLWEISRRDIHSTARSPFHFVAFKWVWIARVCVCECISCVRLCG